MQQSQTKVADVNPEGTLTSHKPFFLFPCSDQAAGDTSRMKELEGILAEARDLESYLKEKKQHLRQMLAVISDKLQG